MKIYYRLLLICTTMNIAPLAILSLIEIVRVGKQASAQYNLYAVMLSVGLFLSLIVATYLAESIMRPLRDLRNAFKKVSDHNTRELLAIDTNDEIGELVQSFNQMITTLSRYEKESRAHERNTTAIQIASQVAHDIRSPLAALDSALKDISQLPEENRLIVRSAVGRIRDIANSLLEKNREATKTASSHTPPAIEEPRSTRLLSSLVDPLVTEKRLQFRSKIGVGIEARLDASSYGLFADIQPAQFKRVLSNIVNNSVEALGNKGLITISLSAQGGKILLKVRDDGKGIPPEIMAKLGQRGETHGKAGGSGLGLYHARTSVESWGGILAIDSDLGKGTTLTITLPQAKAPDWFVSTLEIARDSTVVVLDDDTSIHQVWQERFESAHLPEGGINILHFSTPQELRAYVRDDPPAAREALYLVDYELLGHTETGLNLVEELGLGERAILVTSRFEEEPILAHCERLKVRLIPKGLAGFVPIKAETMGPQAVLLDDDDLVHMTWNISAREHGVELLAFQKPEDLLAALGLIAKDAPIYIDRELGGAVFGETIAKELHAKGFANLYLATGHAPGAMAPMPWIKKVIGKEPPWAGTSSSS